jgi:hypothetical protein
LHKTYLFIYHTNIKPITAKISPLDRNFVSGISFIAFNIFFIALGKIAYNKPSITKRRPIAIPSSFIKDDYFLIRLSPDFPKNLKNSLSGDSINDVSPPIKDFS